MKLSLGLKHELRLATTQLYFYITIMENKKIFKAQIKHISFITISLLDVNYLE